MAAAVESDRESWPEPVEAAVAAVVAAVEASAIAAVVATVAVAAAVTAAIAAAVIAAGLFDLGVSLAVEAQEIAVGRRRRRAERGNTGQHDRQCPHHRSPPHWDRRLIRESSPGTYRRGFTHRYSTRIASKPQNGKRPGPPYMRPSAADEWRLARSRENRRNVDSSLEARRGLVIISRFSCKIVPRCKEAAPQKKEHRRLCSSIVFSIRLAATRISAWTTGLRRFSNVSPTSPNCRPRSPRRRSIVSPRCPPRRNAIPARVAISPPPLPMDRRRRNTAPTWDASSSAIRPAPTRRLSTASVRRRSSTRRIPVIALRLRASMAIRVEANAVGPQPAPASLPAKSPLRRHGHARKLRDRSRRRGSAGRGATGSSRRGVSPVP